MEEKPSEHNVTVELVNPVTDRANRDAPRSGVSLVLSYGVDDADLVAFRAYIQELQAKTED